MSGLQGPRSASPASLQHVECGWFRRRQRPFRRGADLLQIGPAGRITAGADRLLPAEIAARRTVGRERQGMSMTVPTPRHAFRASLARGRDGAPARPMRWLLIRSNAEMAGRVAASVMREPAAAAHRHGRLALRQPHRRAALPPARHRGLGAALRPNSSTRRRPRPRGRRSSSRNRANPARSSSCSSAWPGRRSRSA